LRLTIAPDSRSGAGAPCPIADRLLGGGSYEVTQGLDVNIVASEPDSTREWGGYFVNRGSVSDTGVVVAICAPASRLLNYSLQLGSDVTVPANGQAEAVATCPRGTVSLGGGASASGAQLYDGLDASAPYGTNGWRAYLSAAGSQAEVASVNVICGTKPAGWTQISSAYKANPAGVATSVQVKCPSGTLVLSGGPFNSSSDPNVTIGVTTSLSKLNGWHSIENNASSTAESVDEWAVCADAKRASS